MSVFDELRHELLVLERRRLDAAIALRNAEKLASRLRGKVRVREIARRTKLSPCTISNFFRGRIAVSPGRALDVVRMAEKLSDGK